MLKSKKPPLEHTDTLIGKDSVMEGKIRSQAGIRIEGQMKGDIDCEGDCIIGESSVAESNIRARNVSIAGKVIGDVHASGTLSILSSGTLIGNCRVKMLVIEEGGIFHGQSHMLDNTQLPAGKTSQPVA
ncbi:MAG: hypothetical protein A6D91_11245, partial [Bacillaceae bacterium G1]